MRKLLASVFLVFLYPLVSNAQTGWVITTQDSIFRGYIRMSNDELGAKILLTPDKKVMPRTFRKNGLKFYSIKKDTFAILRDFFPFENEDEAIEMMDARVIISKGRLKLYYGYLPGIYDKTSFIRTPDGGVMHPPYATYVVKTIEGGLHAIRLPGDGFQESIASIIGDNGNLVAEIQSRKLKYKNMKEIIRRYNNP